MTQGDKTLTARNKQLALRFLEVVDRQEFDAVEELLSQDFHLHFSGLQFDREQTMALSRGVYQSFAEPLTSH